MHPLSCNRQHVHYVDKNANETLDDQRIACESPTDDGLKEGALLRSSSPKWQLNIFMLIKSEEQEFVDAHALIDSGCTYSCIDEEFV